MRGQLPLHYSPQLAAGTLWVPRIDSASGKLTLPIKEDSMRAPKRCQDASCMKRYPCKTHPQGWTSSKSSPLPSNWKSLVQTVKTRSEGECEVKGCNLPGNSVDHIIPRAEGGSHSLSNLRHLCKPHHDKKTAEERKRGLKRRSNRES